MFEPSEPWNQTWFSLLKNLYVCRGTPSTSYCVIKTSLKLHYLNMVITGHYRATHAYTYTHRVAIGCMSTFIHNQSSTTCYYRIQLCRSLSIELLGVDNISLNELRQNKSLLRFKFELIITRLLNAIFVNQVIKLKWLINFG